MRAARNSSRDGGLQRVISQYHDDVSEGREVLIVETRVDRFLADREVLSVEIRWWWLD